MHTPKKQRNKQKRQKIVTGGRDEEELAPEPVQADVKHITSLQTIKTTDEEEWSLVGSPEVSELAQKLRTIPVMQLHTEIIRRAGEISMVAKMCTDETEAETLREAARNIIAYTIELTLRALPTISMERRLEMDMDSITRRIDSLEQRLEELKSSLTSRINELISNEYFNSNEKREKVVPVPIGRWTDTEDPDPQVPIEVPGEWKAAAMDWQTVGEKAAGKKSWGKASERRSEDSEIKNRKVDLPRLPRKSVVTITIKKGAAKSYEEVLAAARNNIDLPEVGIESLKMRKTMTGGVVLQVPKDQKREKAAALAAQLTKVLDPNVIQVAAPYRTAEVRVLHIDISVTKDEIRKVLAQKGGCKEEDIQLGEICISKGGLASVWMRCPIGAVRKLVQVGNVTIGWSLAKIEAIERRPLQCFRCLEIGHVMKSCTSEEDRSNLCYKCGVSGHRSKECTAKNPNCPLCEALGAPAAHRMGGPSCAPSRKPVTASQLTDGSAVENGNKKGSPQGTPAPAPANKKLGVEEAMEALHLGNWTQDAPPPN